MAIFVPRFLRQLRDIVIASPADGEVLTYDSADEKWKNEAGGGGGGPPTGAAGGVLGGTYPNPGFAVDMATQAELDAHVTDITDAHDATAVSVAPFGTIAATQVQAALEEIVAEAVTDLGPAVILAPAASARNVIQPTAGDVIAAIVKAHAAQSVDLTQWQDSGGTSRLAVTKFGELRQVLSILDGGVVEGAYEANRFLTDFSLTLDPTSPTVGGVANNAYSFWAQNAVDDKQYHNITTMFAYSLFRGTKTLPPGQGQAVEHTAIYGMGQTHEASTGSITRLRGVNAVALHTGSGSVDELEGVYSLAGLDDFGGAPRIASYMAAFVGETYVLTAGAVVPDMAVFYAKSPDAQAAVTRASGLDVLNQGGANIVTSYGARIRAQSGATTSYGLVVEGGKSLFTDGLVIALIAAPADAAFANGQGGWWWDQANSLPKWKGKTSGGVVVNFTPADAALLADHSARHENGGADAIKLDDFAAPDDNTDLNASTTAHGLLRKLSNTATEYLDGAGAWSVPAGGGGGGAAEDITFTPAGTIAATDVQAAIEEVAAEASGGGMSATLFDANTILKADTDDTPVALTMGASTILARLAAGNIKAATPAELRTLLDVPTTGEAILDALVDAKGDLLTATAADTPARLAAGPNGHLLLADSAETTGLRWGVQPWGSRASAWFATPTAGGLGSGAAFSIGEMYATPLNIGERTITGIGAKVTSSAATSVVRLGIYANVTDGTLRPGALLIDAGTIDASSLGLKTLTISQAVKGLIWLVAVVQTAGCSLFINPLPGVYHGIGYSSSANAMDFSPTGYRHTGATGALPGTFVVADASTNTIRVVVS